MKIKSSNFFWQFSSFFISKAIHLFDCLSFARSLECSIFTGKKTERKKQHFFFLHDLCMLDMAKKSPKY